MSRCMKDTLVLALRYRAEYHERGYGLDGQCDWAHSQSDGHRERPEAEWTVWMLHGGRPQRHPVCRACHQDILRDQREVHQLSGRELEGVGLATKQALQQALAATRQHPAPEHRLRGQISDALAEQLPHMLREHRPRSKYETFGASYYNMVYVNERRDRSTGAERVQLAFEVPLNWAHGPAIESRLRNAGLEAHYRPSQHGAARVLVDNLASVADLAPVLQELQVLEDGWRSLRSL
jgi:hypothetical protein